MCSQLKGGKGAVSKAKGKNKGETGFVARFLQLQERIRAREGKGGGKEGKEGKGSTRSLKRKRAEPDSEPSPEDQY